MFRAFLVLALAVTPATAEVRVVDGDTLAIDGTRIRLFGIDAPERGHPGARCHGAFEAACGKEPPEL